MASFNYTDPLDALTDEQHVSLQDLLELASAFAPKKIKMVRAQVVAPAKGSTEPRLHLVVDFYESAIQKGSPASVGIVNGLVWTAFCGSIQGAIGAWMVGA